jgi:hypothetical protein
LPGDQPAKKTISSPATGVVQVTGGNPATHRSRRSAMS